MFRELELRPEEAAFGFLLAPEGIDNPSPFAEKASLVKELEQYVSKSYPCYEQEMKGSRAGRRVDHLIFNLRHLQKVSDIRAFRFVVNANKEMVLGREGSAGIDIPAHYILSKVNLESKEVPHDYYNWKGCAALAAGRIYLNERGKIYKIDTNSGGFRPNINSAMLALAIICLCAPEMLEDSIDFDVLNDGGHYELTHTFSIAELKSLVLKQFTREQIEEILAKNAVGKVVHLRGLVSSSVRHEAEDASAEKFSSPKKQHAQGAAAIETPTKRPRQSPAKGGMFSTPPRGSQVESRSSLFVTP